MMSLFPKCPLYRVADYLNVMKKRRNLSAILFIVKINVITFFFKVLKYIILFNFMFLDEFKLSNVLMSGES